MTQTSDGYLWLATEFGVVRFDGVRFVPWIPPAGSPWPGDADVIELASARDGSLWIGMAKGLARWKNGKLTTVAELAGHYVSAIREDDSGTVWVGTSAGLSGSARVCAVRTGSVHCDDRDGALGRFVLSLYTDRHKTLWIGSATGVWRWGPGEPTRYAIPPSWSEIQSITESEDGALLLSLSRDIGQLRGEGVQRAALPLDGLALKPTALLRDRDGALWIGTQDRGLVHVSKGRVDRFTSSDGLSGDFVSDIFEDKEGNVWVATLDGLDHFRDLAVSTISTERGLSAAVVFSVLGAPDGTVWLGTLNGLNHWQNGTLSAWRTQPGAQEDGIASLFLDDSGKLWMSSRRGLAYLEKNRLIPISAVPGGYIHAIAQDRAGTMWVSDQESGLFSLRDQRLVGQVPWTQLGGKVARAIAPDPVRGGLWLGFFQGGIAYVENGRTLSSYEASNGLGAGPVSDVFLDARHTLWVATQGGLSRLQDGRLSTLTQKNGLPCNAVHGVKEDDARSLWLSTACGLVRIERSELDAWGRDPARRIRTAQYDDRDGFLSSADAGSFGPKITKAADGRLWFATNHGASVVDPRRIPFNNVAPPVHVEQVTADGTTYDPSTSQLQLPALVRNLRISYTALSLTIPEKVRFRYMLEGRDTSWVEASDRREAFYTDLPPRQYRFRVAARNNDGVWNDEGAALSFSIKPALYQTRGFAITATAVILAALYALYRLHLRRIATQLNVRFEERLMERARIAQDLHDTLLQGFISTSMQLDMVAEEVEGPLRPRLDRVLQRMRDVIDEGRSAVQGLRAKSTLDDLDHALARDAEEFRGHQAVDVRVFVGGHRQPLHPLIRDEVYRIGREALANALRHARATQVEVELEYATRHFRLRVRDNGRGLGSDVALSGRPGHWGIPGMRERADRLGATLALRSRLRAGTEVDLVVPGNVAFQDAENGRDQLFRRK